MRTTPPPLLTELVEGRVWASERPVWFGGVRLRARTSVIRLDDGGLLVHSPAPPTDAWVAQVAALGEVRWLVVPNCFHHLGTPAAATAFPGATVVAPPSAAARNPALRIDVALDAPAFATAVPELARVPLDGVPFLDETLLYHHATETLFGADIVLRAAEDDHWTWRLAARVTGCWKRLSVPPDVRKQVTDRDAASRSLRALRRLSVRRLVIAHGHVVDESPVEQLLAAWRRVGVEA
ncbi:MAG: DUF4336 domain-containing protein [Kofleriaceae bacterium]|nr:DUF4336 domain-containing protein [Kofleriaceae bacterium]MCB9574495.1 DUF4336 domain-containing protein [Kofleriaceae bacterium]